MLPALVTTAGGGPAGKPCGGHQVRFSRNRRSDSLGTAASPTVIPMFSSTSPSNPAPFRYGSQTSGPGLHFVIEILVIATWPTLYPASLTLLLILVHKHPSNSPRKQGPSDRTHWGCTFALMLSGLLILITLPEAILVLQPTEQMTHCPSVLGIRGPEELEGWDSTDEFLQFVNNLQSLPFLRKPSLFLGR